MAIVGVALLSIAIAPMQSRYFEYRSTPDTQPTQFWEVHIFSFSYIARSRTAEGSETSHTQEFNSTAECEAGALDAIAAMLQQGYQEVGLEPAAPAPQSAVLGGRSPQQTAVVLGGLDGLKQRLSSSSIEDLLRTLPDAPQYGDEGLALLIPLLDHDSVRLRAAAFDVLREHASPALEPDLVLHIPYEVFEPLHKLPIRFFWGRTGDHFFITPDSRRVIFLFKDGTIHQFDLHTGKSLLTIQGRGREDENILGAALSPDGTLVYVGRVNGKLEALSVDTGNVVRSFSTEMKSVWGLSLDREGRTLVAFVSQVYGKYFEVWDTQTGKLLQTCEEEGTIGAIAISPDGQHVVTYVGRLSVWDWQQNQRLYQLPQESSGIDFKITPKMQALVVFTGSAYDAFHLATGESKSKFKGGRTFPGAVIQANPLTLAPDGKTLILKEGGFATWWDVVTGKPRRKVPFGRGGIFSPNGQFFVTQADPTIWSVRSRPIQQPSLSTDDALDEYRYLCSCRRHADVRMSITYPTEEALVRNFLISAERNGYQFSVEDIRHRVVLREGGSYYYYELGDRRPANDSYPLRPLNMERPDIDVYKDVMPMNPEEFPF